MRYPTIVAKGLQSLLAAGAAALLALGVQGGCSGGDALPPAELTGVTSPSLGAVGGPCQEGVRRSCSVSLGRQGEVHSCLKGFEECEGGRWGACQGSEGFEVSLSADGAGPGQNALALSAPAPCLSNPCDPACRVYDERPMPALQPTQSEVSLDWRSGSHLDYQSPIAGLSQPCATFADCQLGFECEPQSQTCQRYVAGQVRPACAGWDLVVGPTCREAGLDVIPVCNVGATAAPVGILVYHLPAGQMGSLAPNLSHPSTEYCLTPAVIAPGRCVDVTGCGTIPAGREIVVNPTTGSVHQAAECAFDNNWSVFNAGACNTALCRAGMRTGQGSTDCRLPLRGSQTVGSSLVARWPFDEGSGTTARDADGNGLNLSMSVGTTWQAGRLGNAVVTSPVGPRVGARNNVNFGTLTAISVAAWVNKQGSPGQGGGVLSHVNGGVTLGYQIQWTASDRIQVELGNGTALSLYDATVAPSMNAWHHVAFTWTGATGELNIYLDGELTQTATHAYPNLGASNWTFRVGRTHDPARVFDGAIDDISVYRGVLSAEQIREMAKASSATAGSPSYERARFIPRASPIVPSCGAGKVRWGNRCYWSGEDDNNFDSVENHCMNTGPGGRLVSINRPEEEAFLQAQFLLGIDDPQWIGLNDRAVEGTWVWSDGSCRAYNNWAAFQPDGGTGTVPDQDCVFADPGQSGEKWRDLECSGLGFAPESICEGPQNNAQGSCAPGQFAGPNGRCYEVVTTPLTHSQAASACSAKGLGWGLASISNSDVNNFVAGLLDCREAWIGFAAGASFLPGEPNGVINVSDCLRTDSLGRWLDDTCNVARPYVCEGPPPGGAPEELVRVSSAAACTANNQYYLDDPVHPTLMTLCPALCSRFGNTPSDVTYEFGCPAVPLVEPRVVTEVYDAQCPQGTQVQWSFMTYSTTTPGDSNVEFEVRAALDAAGLGAEAYLPLARAASAPTDTQSCTLVGPAGCPLDLFSLLGGANGRGALELRITLNPGTAGELASLSRWYVYHTCVAAE